MLYVFPCITDMTTTSIRDYHPTPQKTKLIKVISLRDGCQDSHFILQQPDSRLHVLRYQTILFTIITSMSHKFICNFLRNYSVPTSSHLSLPKTLQFPSSSHTHSFSAFLPNSFSLVFLLLC